MSKYQQGPWEVERVGREGNPNDPLHFAIHAMAFGRSVVVADTLNCSCIFSPDDQQANLTLAAAAPAMLALLRRAMDTCARSGAGVEERLNLVRDIRTVLAKAEGDN